MVQDFDLHLHTNNSDGEYTTSELVRRIREANIDLFSITDHDNIDSIEDIKNVDLTGLTYVSGIEISSLVDNKYKAHILGYFIDGDRSALHEICDKLKRARGNRIYILAEMLDSKFNIKLDKEDLDEIVNNNVTPGKPHLAELMVKKGIVSSVREGFDNYLEYLKTDVSNRVDAKIAIDAIKKAGGIVIWAHPKKVEKEYDIDFTEVLDRFIELGIDGIEVYNSLHTYEDSLRYEKVAHERGLITSGGSDYHGQTVKSKVLLGLLFNSGEEVKIDRNTLSIMEVNKWHQ